MFILGISCFYHDSAAALLKDGVLIAAAEEERFSRIKHDRGFPSQAIDFCLRRAGIGGRELDYVVFYEKPLRKFERILLGSLATVPGSWKLFQESITHWFKEKLWVESLLEKKIGLPRDKILFVEHHVSHAASSLFCSPFEEAAILTVDGVGEWTSTAMGVGRASWQDGGLNSIELTHEMRFPQSLGLLYSAFTAFLGFKVNGGEYKVMGMAPYGEPKYVEDVYKVIEVDETGAFRLDMDYFTFHYSPYKSYSRKFERLFGQGRVPESEFFTRTTHPNKDHPHWDDRAAEANQKYADIAASIQLVTEETLLKMARHLQRSTDQTKLCLAGGVALNSVANGRILNETDFEEIFIQPAAGDSGGAVGAALYAYHVLLKQPRRFVMEHAFWGEEYAESEIASFLRTQGIDHEVIDGEDILTDLVAEELARGKVIGWFQGRFEWGPRALGNRSILADPRSAEMKDVVNTKIKFREPFRPFAPVLLEKDAPHFFEHLDGAKRQYPERYMLLVLPFKDGAGDKAQAVNHLGTGRLQTVRPEWNPRYAALVEKFGQLTGVPVLLNTSFNLRGEPIVTSPANAFNTFSNSGIDMLVLGNFIVRKP